MPVLLRDMACLKEVHSNVHIAFFSATQWQKISLMELDESQQHSIEFLKEDSRTKGLYGQQEEKEIIELSKPEVMRDMGEFKNASLSVLKKDVSLEYPESSVAKHKKFLNYPKALHSRVKERTVVNPY
jgi:hypothetical protein